LSENAAPPPGRGGWRDRLTRLVAAVTGYWLVARVLAIMDAANLAGGPLLAAAMTYVTIFAVIPGLLLVSGMIGWVIEDPTIRAELLSDLVALLPPLEEAFSDALDGLVRERGALSLIGLVGLIWGASNFYQALDEVMYRLFPGGARRSQVNRRARSLGAVMLLAGAILGLILLSGLWGMLAALVVEVGSRLILNITGTGISLVVVIVAVLLVYRLVPTAHPSLRAALPPAIVVGIGIGLLTNLYGLIAPLLIGGLAGLGVLAALFGALIWLNFSFQMLIYGAAWARYRRDGEQSRLAAEV
jgi:membrane protein